MHFPPLQALSIGVKRTHSDVERASFERLLVVPPSNQFVLASGAGNILVLSVKDPSVLTRSFLKLTNGKALLCGSSNCALLSVPYGPRRPLFEHVALLNPEFNEKTVLMRIPGRSIGWLVASGRRFVKLRDKAEEEAGALHEALYALHLAGLGVAPRVLAVYPVSVSYDSQPYRLFMYVMQDGFTTLDEAQDDDKLAQALVDLFTRTSKTGAVLVDCKPENVVFRRKPSLDVKMIDFDTLFTVVDSDIEPRSLELTYIVMFLNNATTFGWTNKCPVITAALCARLAELWADLPAHAENELGYMFSDATLPSTIDGLLQMYTDMPLVPLHTVPKNALQKHVGRLYVRMLFRYAKDKTGLLDAYLASGGANLFEGAARVLCRL